MVDIQSATAKIRRGKKERKKKKRKKKEATGQKYNDLPYSIGRQRKTRKKRKMLNLN